MLHILENENTFVKVKNAEKQAGAELCQAQLLLNLETRLSITIELGLGRAWQFGRIKRI